MDQERVIKSEKIFEGKVVSLRCDTVEMEGQRFARREIVEHRGGVAVLAQDREGRLVMVRQFRLAANDFVLELPAGLIDRGESPLEAATRELREETGLEAGDMDFLFEFYTSPGFTNERIHLFMAGDMTHGEMDLDETEDLDLVYMDLDEALKKIYLGEIIDAKTIIGVLALARRRDRK